MLIFIRIELPHFREEETNEEEKQPLAQMLLQSKQRKCVLTSGFNGTYLQDAVKVAGVSQIVKTNKRYEALSSATGKRRGTLRWHNLITATEAKMDRDKLVQSSVLLKTCTRM